VIPSQRQLLRNLSRISMSKFENENHPSYRSAFTHQEEHWTERRQAMCGCTADSESMRSAKTVKGATQLLKTSHVVELLMKGHLDQNKSSTLRELYYISENWDIAKFNEQSESDRLIEDLDDNNRIAARGFPCAPRGERRDIVRPHQDQGIDKTRRPHHALPGWGWRGRIPDTL